MMALLFFSRNFSKTNETSLEQEANLGDRAWLEKRRSLIKCDVGSPEGHHVVAKPLFNIADRHLRKAEESGLISSRFVFDAGDNLESLMVQEKD
jgi:hypothetical protein